MSVNLGRRLTEVWPKSLPLAKSCFIIRVWVCLCSFDRTFFFFLEGEWWRGAGWRGFFISSVPSLLFNKILWYFWKLFIGLSKCCLCHYWKGEIFLGLRQILFENIKPDRSRRSSFCVSARFRPLFLSIVHSRLCLETWSTDFLPRSLAAAVQNNEKNIKNNNTFNLI